MKRLIKEATSSLNDIRDYIIGIVVFNRDMNHLSMIIDDDVNAMRLIEFTQWGVIQQTTISRQGIEQQNGYIHLFEDEESLTELLEEPIRFKKTIDNIKQTLKIK